MTKDIERQVIQIIATDRLDIPISSMSGKLKRAKPKLAGKLDLSRYSNCFEGERVYARVESEDRMKARGMSDAVEEFSEEFPKYGQILKGKIEEKRAIRETYLCFGVNPGCRLTSEDYMEVMASLGFSEGMARNLYQGLMDVSRKLSKARDEERSILIG